MERLSYLICGLQPEMLSVTLLYVPLPHSTQTVSLVRVAARSIEMGRHLIYQLVLYFGKISIILGNLFCNLQWQHTWCLDSFTHRAFCHFQAMVAILITTVVTRDTLTHCVRRSCAVLGIHLLVI